MKRDNKKEVMNALIMVFQFGINMIVPIFPLHTGRCVDWEKDRSGLGNCSIVFIGAFAGANNIYRMVQKFPEARG